MVVPETLKGRMYHTSVTIYSLPKIRIFCFGGIDTWPEDDDIDKSVPVAQTTIVEFKVCARLSLWKEMSSYLKHVQ